MIESDGKLDRKRSFGVVYGDPNIGFMQDNKPYRHDGTPYIAPPVKADQAVAVTQVEDLGDSGNRALTQSQKMKQVWAARRAAENDAKVQP